MDQYELLCGNGIVFTFTRRGTSTSHELFSTIKKNHPIPVLLTSAAGALPEDHPFLADSGVSYDAHHLEDIFGPARGRIMRELTRPLVVHSVSPEVDEIFRPERVRHYLNGIG